MSTAKSRHKKILEQLNELSFVLDVYSKVPAMIVVYNIHTGEYLYANESVKQILGYPVDEIITGGAAFVGGLIHPEDAARVFKENQEALLAADKMVPKNKNEESVATFEYRIRHKDGSWRWLHSDGTVFARDEHGKVEFVMNVSVDITERKNQEDYAKRELEKEIADRKHKETELLKAKELLLAGEERYQAFIRNSNEGIWRVELEKPIDINLPASTQIKRLYQYAYLAEANESMARMYGLNSVNEIVGARLGDMLVQSDERNIEYLTRFIRSGYKLSGAESHEVDKDGNEKIFLNSLVGIVENGKLVRGWGTQHDITQEYIYRQQMIASQEHMALAMKAAAMGSWEWDLRNNQFTWSNEVKNIYGVSQDFQPTFESIHAMNFPEDTEYVLRATRQAIKTGKPYEVEYRIVWTDGSVHWVASYGQVFKSKDGSTRMLGIVRNIDDQKHREEKLSMAVEAGKIATWDWNLITGRIERSVEYYKLLGRKADDLPPSLDAHMSVLHPDDRAQTLTEIQERIEAGTDFEITYRIITPEGSIRWLTDRGKIYRNHTDKPIAVRGTCIDVTDIKNYSEALRINEERLNLALAASKLGLWEWNVETGELIWSDQMKSLYGMKPEDQVTYQDYLDKSYPDDRGHIKATIREAISTGRSYTMDHRVVWPDGSIHWIQGKGRAYLRDGKAYRMAGTSMNIDKQKAASTKLKESEAKFRQLFNNAPDAIIVSTAEGIIIESNEAAARLLGYSEKELCGLRYTKILRRRDVLSLAKLPQSRKKQTEYFAEMELLQKDGTAVQTEITAKLMPDRTWIAFLRDISDRKKHQEAVRDAQVREKLLEEKSALLKQQQYQMKLLNKAKDEFLSVASHHLRTPVTAVKTYLAMLKDGYAGELNRDQLEYVEQAFESNEQQLRVIDDIMNVAEIDTDQVVLQLSQHNLVRLITEVIDNLADKFNMRHQRVHLKTSQPVINASVDNVKFRLVLENLIGNASKYSPEDTQIFIQVTELKNSIRISVTDEGMGIATSDMDRIFEKFARIRNESYKSETGTGLGLYWAKKIIEMHGGAITVKSAVRKGSTFTIKLPK